VWACEAGPVTAGLRRAYPASDRPSLEAFYFAFGEDDVYVLARLPDNVTAAAVGLTVSAAGAVRTSTVVLLTPEEIDEAAKKSVEYRAPGA
jgi:hypothetical protein